MEKQLHKDGRTEGIREDKAQKNKQLAEIFILKETSVFKLLPFSFVKMKPISIARLLFPTKMTRDTRVNHRHKYLPCNTDEAATQEELCGESTEVRKVK